MKDKVLLTLDKFNIIFSHPSGSAGFESVTLSENLNESQLVSFVKYMCDNDWEGADIEEQLDCIALSPQGTHGLLTCFFNPSGFEEEGEEWENEIQHLTNIIKTITGAN